MRNMVEYNIREWLDQVELKLRPVSSLASLDTITSTLKKSFIRHVGEDVYNSKFHSTFFGLDDFGQIIVTWWDDSISQYQSVYPVWKVSEVTTEEVEIYAKLFAEELDIEVPTINYSPSRQLNRMATYWPDTKSISISLITMKQISKGQLFSVIKHEILHHYCIEKGLGAYDTDDDFIKLVIKYGAFVSKEKEAYAAYERYIETHNTKRMGSWRPTYK